MSHRLEGRRVSEAARKRRERQAGDVPGLDVAVSDGRSIGGHGADARQPRTQFHPLRRFARRDEPVAIDYVTRADTKRPADAAIPMGHRVLPVSQLQRMGKGANVYPVADDQGWAQEPDQDYYSGIDWRSPNDMSHGPYRSGPSFAGNPVAFEVRRISR